MSALVSHDYLTSSKYPTFANKAQLIQKICQQVQINSKDMSKDTMKAVIFHGHQKISLQERPNPKLQAKTDIIVEVTYTALCGS